jgi:hypothetical protein
MLSLTFSGPRNQMISSFALLLLDLSNSGTQQTLVRNYTRMEHLDLNTLKLNLTALFSTKMVYAILVVLTVASTFGIKNKILDSFLKLTQVRLHL